MNSWPRLLSGALPHARGGDLDFSRPVHVFTGLLFGGIKRLELPSGTTHRIAYQAADVVRVDVRGPHERAAGDPTEPARAQDRGWRGLGSAPATLREGGVVLVWFRGGGRIALECDAHWAQAFERLSIERTAQSFAKQLEQNPLAWGRRPAASEADLVGFAPGAFEAASGSRRPEARARLASPERVAPAQEARAYASASARGPDSGIVQW
jgi:hypothetical protein